MRISKKWRNILLGIVVLLIVIALALPSILKWYGLHPDIDGQAFNLEGKKALIVTTSHGVLNKPGETAGSATVVFGSEMTIPYYEFLDAKMQVDVASIQGGEIPVDPSSFLYFIKTEEDERYLKDDIFQAKVKNSIPLQEADFANYDVVFFAGGWGAAYDMAQSEILAEKVSMAYYDSDVIFGSVCHGALAFTAAKDTTGGYLVAGRTMTAVTQDQLDFLGIEFTPKHPEADLQNAGANFQANREGNDFFATLTVIDEERRFITGQNQNSGHETSQLIMQVLVEGP